MGPSKKDDFQDATLPRFGRTPAGGDAPRREPSGADAPEVWPQGSVVLGGSTYERILADGELVAGAYRVGSMLGSGGMGEVYEATDVHLGRTVAVKASWPGIADEALLREARILAGFQHPALVMVHGVAFHMGRACMVMERLLGAPLSHRIPRTGGMPLADVFDLLTRISDGLRVLHDANLAHRDLKPANVMVTASGRVVLMDMGIARQEREIRSDQLVSGSVPYMAPETLTNDVRVGQAHLTDLYALGVTAFQMLTSKLPYDSEDILELATMHMSSPVPDVRDLRPDAPDGVADLVTALMAKAPDDRPAGAEEVSAALRRLANPRPRRDSERR